MKRALLAILILVIASIGVSNVEAQREPEFVPNEFIVGLRRIDNVIIHDISRSGAVVLEQIPDLSAVRVQVSSSGERAFVSAMKSKVEVEYIERNYVFKTMYVPNDPYWDNQWGMRIIQADSAWDIHRGRPSIVVAIIDTGIDYTHEDLSERYVPLGYDFANDDDDPIDDFGHGTHCAGIAAATMDNELGVAGVAQVWLMAEKVLNQWGGGTAENIAQGIIHAAEVGANVISISLGGPDSLVLHKACSLASSLGSIIVASAGNEGSSTPVYPAAYPDVVAVSATDEYDEPAGFTNYGDWVELAAPGVNIFSTMPTYHVTMNDWPWHLNQTYDYASGTSMACPHVSGLAALVWSYNYSLTRQQVREHLRNTADDLGDPGKDPYYGYGRINASRAINELGPPLPPDDPPMCSIVDPIQGQRLNGVYRVKINATDDNAVSLVELKIEGEWWDDITGNFDGTYYYYDWDTTTVSDGAYTLLVRVRDNASQLAYSEVTATVDNILDMHVGDISMWYVKRGSRYTVYTKVPILDLNGQAVPGAMVYLDTTLPDNSVQSYSGTTSSDGTVTFEVTSRLTGTYTSAVTDVVKQGWAYEPAGNLETSESLVVP